MEKFTRDHTSNRNCQTKILEMKNTLVVKFMCQPDCVKEYPDI